MCVWCVHVCVCECVPASNLFAALIPLPKAGVYLWEFQMMNSAETISYFICFFFIPLFFIPLLFARTFTRKTPCSFLLRFIFHQDLPGWSRLYTQLIEEKIYLMAPFVLLSGLGVNPQCVMPTDMTVTQPSPPRADRSPESKHCPPEPSNPSK